MRLFFSAVATAIALSIGQIANAADMPVKAPAMTAADWAGWYAGIAGGAGFGQARQTDTSPFSSGRYNTKGAIAGATLGYNWQKGRYVYGIETDLSYANIRGSTVGTDPTFGNCVATHCESAIKALGTLRGRVGMTWKNLLPYVTGGLAYADLHGAEGTGVPGSFGGSGSKWVAGWTLGGGVEAKLTPKWSGKIEYLYVDLGDKTCLHRFPRHFLRPEFARHRACFARRHQLPILADYRFLRRRIRDPVERITLVRKALRDPGRFRRAQGSAERRAFGDAALDEVGGLQRKHRRGPALRQGRKPCQALSWAEASERAQPSSA